MPNHRHYLGSRQVNPTEWMATELTLDFENDKEPTIDLGTLEFKGEDGAFIIEDANTNGFFEGRPYRIDVGELSNVVASLEAYLDYTDNPLFKDCNIVEVAIKRRQGEDWLTEKADTAIFRYMADPTYNGAGKISSNDYTDVPYIINYIPDGTQLLILSLSTFMLTKELIQSIQDIAKQTSDLSTNAVPVTGVSAGFGGGVVTAWSFPKILLSIIKLALTIAYTIGIIFAIIELVKQIIEQLAPVKRFHKGMPIKALAQRGCEYLGLQLKSTLLDELDKSSERWTIIPTKSHKGGLPPTGTPANEFTEVGYPTSEDGFDTLGDLIRFIESTWNADHRLKNGVLEIERRDFWKGATGYVIPNTFTNQEQARNETTRNTNEIIANYVIQWQTDQQDLNTLDNPNGRTVQIVTTPKNVVNPDLVNLKGLKTVNIPLSMAVRKDKLTDIEEALKIFLDAADFLSGQLDKPQSFGANFSARVGSMHLSSHFLSIPKMVVMNGSKLALDQRQIMSAEQLWHVYHFINSFATINGENNQQTIVDEQTIDFCLENFVSLSNNQFVKTETGENAEVTKLVYNLEANTAVISYRIYKVYDENLEVTVLR